MAPIMESLPRSLWPHDVVVWVRSSRPGECTRRQSLRGVRRKRGEVDPKMLGASSLRPPFSALCKEQTSTTISTIMTTTTSPNKSSRDAGDPTGQPALLLKRGAKRVGIGLIPKMRLRVRQRAGAGRVVNSFRPMKHPPSTPGGSPRAINRSRAPRPITTGWSANPTPTTWVGTGWLAPSEWGCQNRSSAMGDRGAHDERGGSRPLARTRLRRLRQWM